MPNRILVIDDDRDYLEILMLKLKGMGFQDITCIDDPLEAAALFDEGHTFDLALIDVTMPDMEFCRGADIFSLYTHILAG